MLYKAIWALLALQIPLGVFLGLRLQAHGRALWVGQDVEPGLEAAAAPAGMAVEQGAG